MKVLELRDNLESLELAAGTVLTIGNFDGVHLGHREILRRARELADEKGVELSVATFEPHPVAILYPEKAPAVLTPLQMKAHQIEQSGADHLIVLKDSRELLRLSAHDFVQKFLADRIKPSVIVEGEDFRFGYGRGANVHTLAGFGQEFHFQVEIVEPFQIKLAIGAHVRASSTTIRNLLEEGRVDDAKLTLGRPYRLAGKIITGKGKGRHLGFPTANLEMPKQIIPAHGVYAGTVEIADSMDALFECNEKKHAIFSIGTSRSYGPDCPLLIEAHLLEENPENLPGKYMAMDFLKHIRDQETFASETELSEQIKKDCDQVRQIHNAKTG